VNVGGGLHNKLDHECARCCARRVLGNLSEIVEQIEISKMYGKIWNSQIAMPRKIECIGCV
jgi:hypothetical protein